MKKQKNKKKKKWYRWKRRPPGGTDILFIIFVMKLCMYVDGPSFNPFKTQSQVSWVIAHSHFTPPISGRNYFTALIHTESRSLASKQVFACRGYFYHFGMPWNTFERRSKLSQPNLHIFLVKIAPPLPLEGGDDEFGLYILFLCTGYL